MLDGTTIDALVNILRMKLANTITRSRFIYLGNWYWGARKIWMDLIVADSYMPPSAYIWYLTFCETHLKDYHVSKICR